MNSISGHSILLQFTSLLRLITLYWNEQVGAEAGSTRRAPEGKPTAFHQVKDEFGGPERDVGLALDKHASVEGRRKIMEVPGTGISLKAL